jgi:hypothetical protein
VQVHQCPNKVACGGRNADIRGGDSSSFWLTDSSGAPPSSSTAGLAASSLIASSTSAISSNSTSQSASGASVSGATQLSARSKKLAGGRARAPAGASFYCAARSLLHSNTAPRTRFPQRDVLLRASPSSAPPRRLPHAECQQLWYASEPPGSAVVQTYAKLRSSPPPPPRAGTLTATGARVSSSCLLWGLDDQHADAYMQQQCSPGYTGAWRHGRRAQPPACARTTPTQAQHGTALVTLVTLVTLCEPHLPAIRYAVRGVRAELLH